MATRLHIGAKELRGDVAAYAKRFDLLELRGVDAASLKTAPSDATLRRWRKAVKPQFEFSVVGGPAVGKLKAGEAFDTELAALLKTAKLLEARVLVIATSSDVTPSKLWRDRLAKLLDRLPRDASAVVWEPSGLWETEDAAAQAARWGVTLAVDPARDPMPAGPIAYGRLRAAGGTRAFSTAALHKIADAIGERRDAYVVFETTGALKEGKILRALVREAKSGARGGLGRLVRPRGAALSAGDDEQDE
jgi:uncharacterized protein YecE (DUF72 family)